MVRLRIPLTALALLTITTACSSPELCDGDRVVWAPGSERITLAKNDSLFVCGDASHAAWKDVPPRQSAAFMRTYLESKGYLDPKIDVDYDARRIVVDAGKRAVIVTIIAEGAPPFWSNRPLESNLGRAIEKNTLDRIEGDAIGLLKEMGYACATLKLEAHPDGRIVLRLAPGTLKSFPLPTSADEYPIPPGVFSRFEPFSPGDRYDVRKTTIAGRRIESEVASNATYTSVCEGDHFKRLTRSASFGPRRSWEIGFGASTEEYPLSFVRWKTRRLWRTASQFQAELFASNIRQKLSFDLKYYYLESRPRLYLRPVFQVEHRNENQYETLETKVSLYQGRAIDLGGWTLEPEIGFSVRRVKFIDSNLAGENTYFTPEFNFGAHTHDYELFRGSPRSGFDNTFNYSYLPGSQAKSVGIHRFLSQGTFLTNYKNYVEPRWVVGFRYTYGTLFTTDGTTPDPKKAPPDWLFLAGGDRDLRGFGRNTLPSEAEGAGAGSVATLGFESRWPNLISIPVEPLIFTDAGFLGTGNHHFAPDLYLAPGLGIRSATPIGTVRVTYARGMIPSRSLRRSQFFLSFGTEF